MSKSQPVTQNSTQQTSIDPWLSSLAQQAGQQGANLPQYTPYTGAGPAGLTPQQLQAMGLSSSNVGQGQAISQSAYNPLSSLTGFQGQTVDANSLGSQIQGLLNPATQNYINTTGAQIDRNTAGAVNTQDQNLAAQHAFGGSRQAVGDAVTQNLGTQAKNQMAAAANQGNYNTALATALSAGQGNQNAATQAANIRLGGANALSGLGSNIAGMNTQDMANLLAAGGVAQNSNTAQNMFNYQQYLNQYQIPDQQATTFASILGSLPHGQTQTGQQTQMSYSNPLMGLGGLGLGLASLGTGGGSTLGGSALSGLGSAAASGGSSLWASLAPLLMASDRRLKEDIEPVGKLFDGTPVYRYRFKDSPLTQIGLMADEVDPRAVFVHPEHGFQMVDYRRATNRAAKKGSF
jgi:hypothetical protein